MMASVSLAGMSCRRADCDSPSAKSNESKTQTRIKFLTTRFPVAQLSGGRVLLRPRGAGRSQCKDTGISSLHAAVCARSFPVAGAGRCRRSQLGGTTSRGGAGVVARRRRILAMNDLVSAFRSSSAYTGCEARTSAASWRLLAKTIRAPLCRQKAPARPLSVGEVAVTCWSVCLAASLSTSLC